MWSAEVSPHWLVGCWWAASMLCNTLSGTSGCAAPSSISLVNAAEWSSSLCSKKRSNCLRLHLFIYYFNPLACGALIVSQRLMLDYNRLGGGLAPYTANILFTTVREYKSFCDEEVQWRSAACSRESPFIINPSRSNGLDYKPKT